MDSIEQSSNQITTKESPVEETPGVVTPNYSVSSQAVNDMKKTKSKWPWIVELIVIVLLIATMVGLIIWQPWKQEKDSEQTGQIENNNDTNVSMPGGGLKGDEVADAGTAADDIDTEIRELYARFVKGHFAGVNTPAEDMWNFRFNSGIRNGQPDRYWMLTLAMGNLERTSCRGTHVIDLGYAIEDCYDGVAMRAEVERLFGQKIQLVEGDVAGKICRGKHYDPENDEFFAAGDGCGFASPQYLTSTIAGAEREGDKIYIYEKVLLVDGNNGTVLYHNISDDGEMESEYLEAVNTPDWEEGDDYINYHERLDEVLSEYVLRSGDEFKWTFRKTDSGNYVFEKIERI